MGGTNAEKERRQLRGAGPSTLLVAPRGRRVDLGGVARRHQHKAAGAARRVVQGDDDEKALGDLHPHLLLPDKAGAGVELELWRAGRPRHRRLPPMAGGLVGWSASWLDGAILGKMEPSRQDGSI